MPLDEKILGFSNSWYKDGFKNSVEIEIDGTQLKVLSFPYFLATKLEAFMDRGTDGFLWESKDFEDIIVTLEGRLDVLKDFQELPKDIERFLRANFKILFSDETLFREAVIGCLGDYGAAVAPVRARVLIEKLNTIKV